MENMTKVQKIWLVISATFFIIPELLWSPVLNFIYIFFQNSNHPVALRGNFLTYNNPGIMYRSIIFIQMFGLLFYIFGLYKNKKNYNSILFYVLLFLTIILFLITLGVFYLITFVNISFP